jgi:hypothetical protein
MPSSRVASGSGRLGKCSARACDRCIPQRPLGASQDSPARLRRETARESGHAKANAARGAGGSGCAGRTHSRSRPDLARRAYQPGRLRPNPARHVMERGECRHRITSPSITTCAWCRSYIRAPRSVHRAAVRSARNWCPVPAAGDIHAASLGCLTKMATHYFRALSVRFASHLDKYREGNSCRKIPRFGQLLPGGCWGSGPEWRRTWPVTRETNMDLREISLSELESVQGGCVNSHPLSNMVGTGITTPSISVRPAPGNPSPIVFTPFPIM